LAEPRGFARSERPIHAEYSHSAALAAPHESGMHEGFSGHHR
jgi:hypothetical protein